MNDFTTTLIAALRDAGFDAAVNPTGGGCEEIGFVSNGTYVSITDGDASLPGGVEFDGITALIRVQDVDQEDDLIDPIGINSHDPHDLAKQIADAI